ncbi:MAG TPA: oligosaccharide flippase family protein [Planctomycetota bacterium]|nr:oligosaccharide flippase family protein [Planctomycetota bacterium]
MKGFADRSVLARNTVWSVVGYAVQFLTPVLLTPFVVSSVGADQYGRVWVTLFTLASWLGYFDLGLWGSLTRDVAERRTKGDQEGLRTLWATWWTYDLVLGGLVTAATALAAPHIVRYFAPLADASFVPLFVGLAVQAATGPVLRHLSCTLTGLQRLDLFNLMAITVTPLWAAGQVLALVRGFGLWGLMINGLLFSGLQVAVLLFLIGRQGHPIGFSPARFSWAECRRLLSFGWKVQATLGLNQAFRNDRLVMGRHYAEGTMIASYQFGANIVNYLAGAIGVLSSGVLPAVSDLATRGDLERIGVVFSRGTKYHALAAFGLIGFAALFARELLVFWMGRPLPDSVVVLRIMAVGAAATAIGSCGQSVAVALGRPGWTTLTGALGLGATVILYMTVGRRYDYVGLAASVSAGLALIQIIFMSGLHGFLEFRWREYVGNALIKPAVLAVPLAGVYAAWGAAAPHLPAVDTRGRAFLVLAPAFLLTAVLGWAVARLFRVVDDVDLEVLKSSRRRSSS